MDIAPDFRPFTAADDGTRLVLRRALTVSAVLLRACMYLLLAVVLGLFVLMLYGAWLRTTADWWSISKSVLLLAVLAPLNWFALRLVLLGFHLEGVQRIDCGPDGVELVARGAVRRRHDRVRGVVALEARTVRTATEHRDVRWLELFARTAAGKADLGYLALHPEAEPTRETAVRAAAGRIAARLRVPLELYDEDGKPVAPA